MTDLGPESRPFAADLIPPCGERTYTLPIDGATVMGLYYKERAFRGPWWRHVLGLSVRSPFAMRFRIAEVNGRRTALLAVTNKSDYPQPLVMTLGLFTGGGRVMISFLPSFPSEVEVDWGSFH